MGPSAAPIGGGLRLVGHLAFVPYTADYIFYKKARDN